MKATMTPAETPPERRRLGLTSFEWGCIAVAAFAFLVRGVFIYRPEIIWDSAWFLTLARSFGTHGNFYLPWSAPDAPQYSGYWPPLFPIYLAPFVKVFGASYHTLALGSATASLLLTIIVFFATRDLYDRTRAFAAMAMVAASPAFIASDGRGMSESLLACMVVLTIWAFLKSLERPAWLPVAGVFALLAYLGKASLGLPFVAAGVIVLAAFRIRYRGWRNVVRSPVDISVAVGALAAGIIFAATRTEKFGGIGLNLMEPLAIGIKSPWWAPLFVFKVFFVGVFLLAATLPLSLKVREAWRVRKNEREAALWLAVLIPLFAGAVYTATFYITEGRNITDFDNIRYLTPGIVPFIWLMLPHYDFTQRVRPENVDNLRLHKRHVGAYAAAIGAFALIFLLNPMAAAETLGRLGVFLMLAIIPLALGAFVLTTHYRVQSRRTASGKEERKLVSALATAADARFLIVFALLGVVLAYWISAWYAYVALAFAVVSTSMNKRTRILAMALLLIAATAPSARTELPAEEAAEGVKFWLPEGSRIGVDEHPIYFAAVAPEGYQLVYLLHDIPPDLDGLLLQGDNGLRAIEGYHPVQGWDYGVWPDPAVALELKIELALTGKAVEIPDIRAYTLFLRDAPTNETAPQE